MTGGESLQYRPGPPVPGRTFREEISPAADMENRNRQAWEKRSDMGMVSLIGQENSMYGHNLIFEILSAT